MRSLFLGIVFGFATTGAIADTIKLNSGRSVEGVIVKETGTSVLVCLKHGMIGLEKSDIKSITKAKNDDDDDADLRLYGWQKCVAVAVRHEWGANLHQIPATVIDKGTFKNVPYSSFSSGNYEVNIYGTPDVPAGIEIGVKGGLIRSAVAKRKCLEFMVAIVKTDEDKAVLKSLNLDEGKKERDGLTFEVTPETANDAYGQWWVSVYDAKGLDASRATETELKSITVSRDKFKKPGKSTVPDNSDRPPTDILLWGPDDLSKAPSRASGSSSSGTVYVRGYYRKDGTYVSPHTRSAPHRK